MKTQRLLEELRTVKSSNATEIRRLKQELASLRKIMIGYINQIDSLNRLTVQQKQVIARCDTEVQCRITADKQPLGRKKRIEQESQSRRTTRCHQYLDRSAQ